MRRLGGHFRLAQELGKHLHEVMGWPGPPTHRQFLGWMMWLFPEDRDQAQVQGDHGGSGDSEELPQGPERREQERLAKQRHLRRMEEQGWTVRTISRKQWAAEQGLKEGERGF